MQHELLDQSILVYEQAGVADDTRHVHVMHA